MAGLSKRFFDVGYKLPKYMLELGGAPVFDHAIGSFERYFENNKFLIICRDVFDTPYFIKNRCRAVGLSSENLEIVVLDQNTRGQAETVAIGMQQRSTASDQPITIFNIDTFRPNFEFPAHLNLDEVDGFLEVFEGPGDHWSFAKTADGCDRVVEVAEKTRISNLCSNGLYQFRSSSYFLSLYSQISHKNPRSLQGGEFYIAPLYNLAIDQGADIRCVKVPRKANIFCGTPDEFEFLKKNNFGNG